MTTHMSSDLAQNIGIKFLTPEEFFLGERARPFKRDFEPAKLIGEEGKAGRSMNHFSLVHQLITPAAVVPTFSKLNKQDLVIFCGSPGAGKSTFYWKHLKPLGYERVNQDLLKTVRFLLSTPAFRGTFAKIYENSSDVLYSERSVSRSQARCCPTGKALSLVRKSELP